MMNNRNWLNEIIHGENLRLKKTDDPFLETGYMGSSIALFSLYRVTKDKIFAKMAETHLDLMRLAVSDKVALEINNGLSGVGLGMTWLVENGFISGDLNNILKEIDDQIYRYCVRSLSEYNHKYESTYLDILIYMAVRMRYIKSFPERTIFIREAQMLFDHIYFNISNGFLLEPSPANIRYKLFLFIFASSLLCKNGDIYIKNRIVNVFDEIHDIIVTIFPFYAVNRFMLHLAIELLLPYLDTNIENWKEYSSNLENDTSIKKMVDETQSNDMSVFHGIPYIYLLLKYSNTNIPNNTLNDFINRIETVLSLYPDYTYCESWDYVGLSGIMGTIVVLEDIKSYLTL